MLKPLPKYNFLGYFFDLFCLYCAAVHEQLVEFEKRLFDSNDAKLTQSQPPLEPVPVFGFGFGFPRSTTAAASVPLFNQGTTPSIFERPTPNNFTFGARGEAPMDGA